jgi:diguanylate cyclase (GGDEF)-like protein
MSKFNIYPQLKPQKSSHLFLSQENKKLNDQLKILDDSNGIDVITGLLNNKALQAKIIEQNHDVRSTANKNITFAYIDLDDLKLKNDSLGHHGGDKYIQSFATDLRQHFRENEYIYRINGSNSDEFGILIESDQVELISNKLLNFKEKNPNYNFSVGIKCGSRDQNGNLDLAEIIKQADLQMLDQKSNKKSNGVK